MSCKLEIQKYFYNFSIEDIGVALSQIDKFMLQCFLGIFRRKMFMLFSNIKKCKFKMYRKKYYCWEIVHIFVKQLVLFCEQERLIFYKSFLSFLLFILEKMYRNLENCICFWYSLTYFVNKKKQFFDGASWGFLYLF